MKIRKGDTVKVLYGKDSGKTGVVVSVLNKTQKIVVDGVNIFKRALKGDGQKRKSEIINVVRPMHLAKVMLVCPNCKKPVRVAMKESGKNFVRVCNKCKKELDVKKVVKEEKKKVVKKETKVKKSTK